MDDALGTPRSERHLECIQHQPGNEPGAHRPTDNASAAGVENNRQIQKARRSRNVGNVRHPQQVGMISRKLALDQIRRLPAAAPHGRGHEPAAAYADQSRRCHQSGHALAADANPILPQFGMDARRAICAVRGSMRCANVREHNGIRLSAPRRFALRPCIIAAGGDTQEPAHGGDRIDGLVFAHESESLGGILFVSRANQAAAFDRISRSRRSCRFSRRSRSSSSRSDGIRLPLPSFPAAFFDPAAQFLIDCGCGPNSFASSAVDRPA
jgi:hypothetical protein